MSQARLLLPAAPSLPDSAPTLTLEEQKPQLAAGGLEETFTVKMPRRSLILKSVSWELGNAAPADFLLRARPSLYPKVGACSPFSYL